MIEPRQADILARERREQNNVDGNSKRLAQHKRKIDQISKLIFDCSKWLGNLAAAKQVCVAPNQHFNPKKNPFWFNVFLFSLYSRVLHCSSINFGMQIPRFRHFSGLFMANSFYFGKKTNGVITKHIYHGIFEYRISRM